MLEYLYKAVQYAFDQLNSFMNYLWGIFWTFAQGLIDGVSNYFPSLTLPAVPSGAVMYLKAIDTWVPLHEGVTLLGLYLAFYLLMIPIRFLLNFIPFT